MSEFSPLRDPVFLLTWQVHLSVVILFALLGIWAGLTRRPWYVAPTLFLALLWLFIPLEAPEPVVVLLLTVPVLAIACRIARRWLEQPTEEPNESSPSRLRFSLRDLLCLMVLVGMTTALLVQVWRMPWKIHWPDTALSAASFCLISVGLFVARYQASWRWRWLLTAAVLLLLLPICTAHYHVIRRDWLLLNDWEHVVTPVTFGAGIIVYPRGGPIDALIIYTLTFIAFIFLLRIGLALVNPIQNPSRFEKGRRIAASALTVTVILGLGIVYTSILTRPGWPAERWPESNDRDALLALLEHHRQLNPQELSLSDLQASGGTAASTQIAELFQELDDLLQQDNVTLFDSRVDKPSRDLLPHLIAARSIARALSAQADSDWMARKREDALKCDLLCLRFAQVFQRRCTVVHALSGVAIEGMALHHLAEIRAQLSCDESHQIIRLLADLEDRREPVDLLIARDTVYEEEADGWRGRLAGVARRLLGDETAAQSVSFARRDTLRSLLRADLAVRCYYQTRGRYPDNLSALPPAILSSEPTDFFSGKPLIYRVEEGGFALYSVSYDGIDDGGHFDSHRSISSGYDLNLEVWMNPDSP